MGMIRHVSFFSSNPTLKFYVSNDQDHIVKKTNRKAILNHLISSELARVRYVANINSAKYEAVNFFRI